MHSHEVKGVSEVHSVHRSALLHLTARNRFYSNILSNCSSDLETSFSYLSPLAFSPFNFPKSCLSLSRTLALLCLSASFALCLSVELIKDAQTEACLIKHTPARVQRRRSD